jgi:hypothetical protein
MPKHLAAQHDADAVQELLHKLKLTHLRARRRADLVTIESGPSSRPIPHARLRRDTVHLWRLEMPVSGNRWQPTFDRGLLDAVVRTLVEQYPWMVTAI